MVFCWNLNCADKKSWHEACDGSFRTISALCDSTQSSKICQKHQITKHEHWNNLLPEHKVRSEKVAGGQEQLVLVTECHLYIQSNNSPLLLLPPLAPLHPTCVCERSTQRRVRPLTNPTAPTLQSVLDPVPGNSIKEGFRGL